MTHVLYDNESLALGEAVYQRYEQCCHGYTFTRWDLLPEKACAMFRLPLKVRK